MTVITTCSGHHAHRDRVLRCELAIGHSLPHAKTLDRAGTETNRDLVTWAHDRGRRAAEAMALRFKRDRLPCPPAPNSVGLTLARLAAALAMVVALAVLVAGRTA
jgi:hypothetical protein